MTRTSIGARMRLPLACLFAGLAWNSGCLQVEVTKPHWPVWLEGKPESPPIGQVARVTSLWQDSMVFLPDPSSGGNVLPGFSGKIFFTDPDEKIVTVNGVLTIQLYDDAQEPRYPPVPRYMWNIDPDNLQRILRKDTVGWTYNLWLPWYSYDPKVSKVTLIAVYKDKNGHQVWSQPQYLTVQDQNGPRRPPQLEVNSFLKKPGS